MKLYVSPRTPNPRRVTMFIAEKGIAGIEEVSLDLMAGQHRDPGFLEKNPMGRVPALDAAGRARAGRNARHLHVSGRTAAGTEPDGRGLRGARLY